MIRTPTRSATAPVDNAHRHRPPSSRSPRKVAAGPKPKRSVTLLAVTLEESGLLGSAYFGENPLIPLKNIVGGINIDAMQPTGLAKDMIVDRRRRLAT